MSDSFDIESIVLCATNEGEMYSLWVELAQKAQNVPDSLWAEITRNYVRKLLRTNRYDGSYSAETINTAAARVRDYYIAHVAEIAQVESGQ